MRKALLALLLLVWLALPLAAQGAEGAPGQERESGAGQEPPMLDPPPFEMEEERSVAMGKTPSGFEYVLYSDDEFAPWQRKLRRAEVLFFGGLPLSFAAVGLFCSLFNIHEDFWPLLGISAGISAVISIADFIAGETEGGRDRKTLR